jgi:hypothetical protein
MQSVEAAALAQLRTLKPKSVLSRSEYVEYTVLPEGLTLLQGAS